MSRRAPTGPPATRPAWVYLLHFLRPFPEVPAEGGQQARHYSGKTETGVPERMTVQGQGGPDAARLLQLLKQAGIPFVLAAVEYGTNDNETRKKYRAATDRCTLCQAGEQASGNPHADPGWVYVLHLERPTRARPGEHAGQGGGQPAHHVGTTSDTAALLAATRRGGLEAARFLGAPPAPAGARWRLVWARRDPLGHGAAAIARRLAKHCPWYCPCCRASREQAAARDLLAAIARGEVADRLDPATGRRSAWRHTLHGEPVRSPGPGGHLGRRVAAADVAALARRGLVVLADVLAPGGDRPYRITRAGAAALRAAGDADRPARPAAASGPPGRRIAGPFRAVRIARTDGLPVNRDGSLSRSRTSDEEKALAGVMTSQEKAAHTALRKLDNPRTAVRTSGLLPADEWSAPALQAIPADAGPQTSPRSPARARADGPADRSDPSWPSSVRDGIAARRRAAAASRAAVPAAARSAHPSPGRRAASR